MKQHESLELATCMAWSLTWTRAFPTLAVVAAVDDASTSLVGIQHHHVMRQVAHDAVWGEWSTNAKCNLASLRYGNNNSVIIGDDGMILSPPGANAWSNSRGYGVMTRDAVWKVLDCILMPSCTPQQLRIVDLGSGDGTVLRAAAVSGWLRVGSALVGLEIVHALHKRAVRQWHQCWQRHEQFVGGSLSLFFEWDWRKADFVQDLSWLPRCGDSNSAPFTTILLCHATHFETALITTLDDIFVRVATGWAGEVAAANVGGHDFQTVAGEQLASMPYDGGGNELGRDDSVRAQDCQKKIMRGSASKDTLSFVYCCLGVSYMHG